MSSSNQSSKYIHVDLVSDLACPWCYVGVQNFILAQQDFTSSLLTSSALSSQGTTITTAGTGKATTTSSLIRLHIHPYMIDPNTDMAGEPFLDYNVRRWGGAGWTRPLIQKGKQVGCPFQGWKWWPNTLHAHRLIMYAEECAKQQKQKALEGGDADPYPNAEGLPLRVKMLLFEYSYERSENISLLPTLIEVAQEVQLPVPKQGWLQWFQSSDLIDRVRRQDGIAKSKWDIHGVPTFRFSVRYTHKQEDHDPENDEVYSVSGAQPADYFLGLFNRLHSNIMQD